MSSNEAISTALKPIATAPDSLQAEAWLVETDKPALPPNPPPFLALFSRDSPLWKSYQDSLQAQRTRHFVMELKSGSGQQVPGYAQAAADLEATTSKVAARSSTSKTTTGGSTRGEWGFLNDSRMSTEDKLFLFIKLVQKNTDQELDKKMKEYRDKYCSTGSNTSSSTSSNKSSTSSNKSNGSGGLFGFLGDVFTGGWLKDALEQAGGLLATAAGAALGLGPFSLVLTTAGKQLGRAAASAIGLKGTSSSGSSEKSSGSSEKKEGGTPDERLDMLEIQRLADKQKQMFDCVSNILRVIHETGMTAVGNIR